MLIDTLKDQWICGCGNWVDAAFDWCPDCCKDKFIHLHEAGKGKRRL